TAPAGLARGTPAWPAWSTRRRVFRSRPTYLLVSANPIAEAGHSGIDLRDQALVERPVGAGDHRHLELRPGAEERAIVERAAAGGARGTRTPRRAGRGRRLRTGAPAATRPAPSPAPRGTPSRLGSRRRSRP